MITPADLLRIANHLLKRNTEADWRSSISRSYYAAFHAACNFLRDLGFAVPQDDSAHHYAYSRLFNCGTKQVAVLADKLADLRRQRNQADYECSATVRQGEATDALRNAQDILYVLDNLPPVTRSSIATAIERYEMTAYGQTTRRPPPP